MQEAVRLDATTLSEQTFFSRFGVAEKILLAISVLCGTLYLAIPFLSRAQLWNAGTSFINANVVIKTLSVAALSVIAFRILSGRDALLLGTALAFSSLGDFFLALRGGDFFVYGLSSFLIAHLFFIALWIRHWHKPLTITAGQKILLGIIGIFFVLMLWWLLPATGGLAGPVTIYMSVLTAMVIAAALASFSSKAIVIGAILFLISDAIIGISKFNGAISGLTAGFLIWSTYYLAQYLMTMGFIREKSRR